MGRHRRGAEGLRPARAEIRLISDVGHVADHLDDVAERRAVLVERALNLVERVFALGGKIALVENVAGLAVLVLGAHASEKDHLARPGHGYCLGEASLGPFTVVVVLLLEGLRLRVRHATAEERREDGKRHQPCHVTSPCPGIEPRTRIAASMRPRASRFGFTSNRSLPLPSSAADETWDL